MSNDKNNGSAVVATAPVPTGKPATQKPNSNPAASALKVVQHEEPKQEQQKLTAPEILQKVDTLNKLNDKRERLLNYQKEIKSFRLSSDSMTTTLSLEDRDGNSFRTSRPDLVETAIGLLNERIETALTQVNAEIEAEY